MVLERIITERDKQTYLTRIAGQSVYIYICIYSPAPSSNPPVCVFHMSFCLTQLSVCMTHLLLPEACYTRSTVMVRSLDPVWLVVKQTVQRYSRPSVWSSRLSGTKPDRLSGNKPAMAEAMAVATPHRISATPLATLIHTTVGPFSRAQTSCL